MGWDGMGGEPKKPLKQLGKIKLQGRRQKENKPKTETLIAQVTLVMALAGIARGSGWGWGMRMRWGAALKQSAWQFQVKGVKNYAANNTKDSSVCFTRYWRRLMNRSHYLFHTHSFQFSSLPSPLTRNWSWPRWAGTLHFWRAVTGGNLLDYYHRHRQREDREGTLSIRKSFCSCRFNDALKHHHHFFLPSCAPASCHDLCMNCLNSGLNYVDNVLPTHSGSVRSERLVQRVADALRRQACIYSTLAWDILCIRAAYIHSCVRVCVCAHIS